MGHALASLQEAKTQWDYTPNAIKEQNIFVQNENFIAKFLNALNLTNQRDNIILVNTFAADIHYHIIAYNVDCGPSFVPDCRSTS